LAELVAGDAKRLDDRGNPKKRLDNERLILPVFEIEVTKGELWTTTTTARN
jgi:hypothetical protein